MIWALLVLAACALVAYKLWQHSQPPLPPPDPEQAIKAAVELHKIRRRLDASLAKTEQRRNLSRLRREIGEAMKEPEDR
ncbi:MAG TPA: hypothetical protein VFH99_03100 [Candidatus Saccharimonadales bacterium]|nr:hypothetical protein [Candidatus Saccharimonadales bacterium]